MAGIERTATRITGFANPELDFQLMRMLGAASYGGGAPGEIFAARAGLDETPREWPRRFADLAADIERMADVALGRGHRVSAREHYGRAAMYYRSAEYFCDPFAGEALQYGLASQRCFAAAMPLFADSVTAIDIPFGDLQLPGYFCAPAGGAVDGRTLVAITGFDGTNEEMFFSAARAGLERGFNVLLAQGPGQVSTMRRYPDLVFRPDYEVPLAAVVDAALARPEVNPDKLGLYGVSFGGYFATRAAIHDPRIRALVLNSPIVDLKAYLLGFLPPGAEEMEDLPLSYVDELPDEVMPLTMKLSFKSACRRYGVDSSHAWLKRLADFRAEEGLERIACPTLALVGEGEGEEALRQLDVFASKAGGRVTRHVFTRAEGADMHCQVGNLPLGLAVVFDWLEEVL